MVLSTALNFLLVRKFQGNSDVSVSIVPEALMSKISIVSIAHSMMIDRSSLIDTVSKVSDGT